MGSPTCPTCGSSHRDVYGGCRVVVDGRYSPDPWHTATPTPPAPADDASGAEAMRERAAKVAETHYLQPCPTLCGQSIATAIRALPLPGATPDATRVPATDDAVEEAARALIESVPPDFWNNDPPTDDTEVAYAIDYALLDALRAALRREKESRSDDSRPASGQGGDK